MKDILDFLSLLEANNTTDRFHAHQEEYLSAKTKFLEIVTGVKDQLAKQDPFLSDIDIKKTLFRINRDIRFSKDKSPYKTNFWAVVAPWGTKSKFSCYYIHIQPGNYSFVWGWIYRPEPDQMKYTRDYIQQHFIDFQQLISDSQFKENYGILQGRTLSRVPKGYDKDSLAWPFLKMKDRYTMRQIKDSELLTGGNIITKISSYLEPLVPFNTSINERLIDYDVNSRVTK